MRRINQDATLTDQWIPSVAVNPAGTQILIGYYRRQVNPTQNNLIRAYGAKADLTGGLANADFEFIPLSTAFEPLFPGTTQSTPPQNTWMYDHVWVQTGVCFDEDAKVIDCNDPDYYTGPILLSPYEHFMADDYTWASADETYFYFAWCDRTDAYCDGGNCRPDPNIRFAKVEQ